MQDTIGRKRKEGNEACTDVHLLFNILDFNTKEVETIDLRSYKTAEAYGCKMRSSMRSPT